MISFDQSQLRQKYAVPAGRIQATVFLGGAACREFLGFLKGSEPFFSKFRSPESQKNGVKNMEPLNEIGNSPMPPYAARRWRVIMSFPISSGRSLICCGGHIVRRNTSG